MTTPVHVTYDDLEGMADALARQLKDHNYDGIVGVARGGFVPATMLAYRLGIRRVASLSVASYDHQKQKAPEVLVLPDLDLSLKWLVVEDIVDTGQTAKLVRKIWPKIDMASFFIKPAGQKIKNITAYRLVPQDTWVYFPWEKE